ncbi:MAG: hypothetical protein KAG61_00460 [Bacteriovoracaceae bacterium]|nr:hypothetical protein [Bacteriovoracaceae bacterium]
MLDKNIDHVIVGSSYLSYFLGLKSLGANKSTLIVDDKRFQFGELFQGKFTELDRSFIKKLGELNSIQAFIDIDQYIEPAPYFIHVNGAIVRLGDSPLRNFKEVGRKLHGGIKNKSKEIESDIYSNILDEVGPEKFNNLFETFCRDMAVTTLGLPSTKHFDLSTFFKCAPPFLITLFDTISKSYSDQDCPIGETWSMRCLLYSLRGVFQDDFSFSLSKFELFHLVVSFLSPSYQLNFQALDQALSIEFAAKGGQLRQVELDSWLFDKNRPWALMLSSFEGVVCPGDVSFIGPIPESMPIEISPVGDYYKAVEYTWDCIGENTLLPSEGTTFFCCSDAIGTETPFFWCKVKGNQVVISAYLLRCEGRKFDFYVDRLREYLLKEINRTHSITPKDIKNESVRELRDIALSGVSAGGAFEQVSSSKVQVLDNTNISNKVLVGGVSYWGQFRKFPLGKYSMLLDLCLS